MRDKNGVSLQIGDTLSSPNSNQLIECTNVVGDTAYFKAVFAGGDGFAMHQQSLLQSTYSIRQSKQKSIHREQAFETVQNTLAAMANMTDNEHLIEMIAGCMSEVKELRAVV